MNYDQRQKLGKELAGYIINTHCTIREVAKYYNLCKSTVHHYLKKLDNPLIKLKLEKILKDNKYLGTIRGGKIGGKVSKRKKNEIKIK